MPTFIILKGASSNKQEGIGKNEEEIGKKEGYKEAKIDGKDICYFPIKGRVALLNPFIDKISITYKIADEELKVAVIEALKLDVEEKTAFHSAKDFKTGGVPYAASVHLIVPPKGEKVLIQAGPKKMGLSHNLRLEFNPRALGPPGIAFLKSQLENLIVGGLSYAHILLKGKVTRVDVAVDLIGIRIDHLDIQFLKASKSHWYYSSTGAPQTGYLGIKPSPKVKNASWVAYNKRAQLKDTGKTEQEQLYGGLSHTRIEFHAQPMKCFGDLAAMKNPFSALSLAYPSAPKGVKPYTWLFFLDACHRRGHKVALAQLPDGPLRTRYAKALEKAHADFWKPDLIWAAWDKALDNSGLMDVSLSIPSH